MAKATSGYLKPKKKTLKELEEALDINPIDAKQHEMDKEEEDRKGITDHIRDIFKK